jgi:hypothetical protein
MVPQEVRAVIFSKPEALQDKVGEVIQKYHKTRLEDVVILAFLREPPQTSQGNILPGRVYLPSAFIKHLCEHGGWNEPDVIMEVSQAAWASEELGEKYKEALIDHLLSYIQEGKKDGAVKIVAPVGEHRQVLERHGKWSADLKHSLDGFEKMQHDLPLGEEEQGEAA